MKSPRVWPILAVASLLVMPIWLGGCGSPSAANIALRKQLQQRDDQIANLKRQHVADVADRTAHLGPTTTSLSSDTLSKIYTTHGIKLGRLTGGDSVGSSAGTDGGLKVEVTPIDDDGQSLKAAGSIQVTAFDLHSDGEKVGDWTFDRAASRAAWHGSSLLYAYLLPCPWQGKPPARSDLTVRVRFTDELTGRTFVEQKQVHVNPPSTTQLTPRD